MSNTRIDYVRLRTVIEDCLKQIPKTEYVHLPEVLLEKGQTRFFILSTDEFIIIDFLDDEEAKRISDLKEKNYFPFPGLIKPKQLKMSAAFQFERAKYAFVQGCSVNNMFSFALGRDSTIIIQNHSQQIKTEELKESIYTIKLAYLISFGDDITQSNIYDVVRDLMLESFRNWGIKLA
jgi:hypothetical protein